MKKIFRIILAIAILSFTSFVINGACERAKAPENATTQAQAAASTAPQPEPIPSVEPDPPNAVHFTIAYQNNMNGTIESCG